MRAGSLLIALVLVAACSGSGQDPSTTGGGRLPPSTTTPTTASVTTPAAGATSTSPSSTTTSSPSSTATTAAEVPTIVIADGAVSGPEAIEVTLGEEAVWEVTSDSAIEIHVHGYDLVHQLTADETTEVRFLADVPGIFEVETHPGHQVVVEVIVEP